MERDGIILAREEVLKIINKDENDRRETLAALADLKYSQKKIDSIIDKFGYTRFPANNVMLDKYGSNDEFNRKYMCHDGAEKLQNHNVSEICVVSGFGPTNSPTIGTLSTIQRILEIQQATNVECHIVISELGALNSRNKSLYELVRKRNQFIDFIIELGFNEKCGELRTHKNEDMLRLNCLVTSLLSAKDFAENKEATEPMYERLGLSGNDFSTMVDKAFTVSDILLPLIRDKKKMVLVAAGIEEHYYPRLAKIVMERALAKQGGLEQIFHSEANICSVYGRLIRGLYPYVKMSKSIDASSIRIDEEEGELRKKVLKGNPIDEPVIWQIIQLTSNWSSVELKKAERAFNDVNENEGTWSEYKEKYFEQLLKVKRSWEKVTPKIYVDLKSEVFGWRD